MTTAAPSDRSSPSRRAPSPCSARSPPQRGRPRTQPRRSTCCATGCSPGRHRCTVGSVTIPGWSVAADCPRWGATGTAVPEGARPGVGRGAGGRRASSDDHPGAPRRSCARPGTRYALSAELGGTAASRAGVAVAFLSAGGRVLGRRELGPWEVRGARSRASSARVADGEPAARRRAGARVATLATSLTNYDGPDAPLVGYDRAVAGASASSCSRPRRPAPLRPRAAGAAL